ncbi:LOW QUALITY PROTEIN: hypothetical protein CFOL_v3_22230, partial [Cephalotus follicularis]
AKTKQEGEVEKPDGLEITAIGSLYKGPWDKKYWSSSRGKDRYPYPVGFQAVRAHNGSRCKIEIHEGSKGPLFVVCLQKFYNSIVMLTDSRLHYLSSRISVGSYITMQITSGDGLSFSGETPDIAWDKFQKKGCPRTKILHGKRFSCKIDGIGFFGFKNPFVQRLLRELAANINGTAEQSLVASSICNGDSRTNDNRYPDMCTYPDLLPFLARPQITKKRSRGCTLSYAKSVSGAGLKRPRTLGLTSSAEDSSSAELYDHLRDGTVPTPKETKINGSHSCESTGIANNFIKDNRHPDRSGDTDAEEISFPMETEDKDASALVQIFKDSPGVNDVDLCAPDTLDFVQDTTTNSSPSSQDKSPCTVKEEITAANMIIPEGLVTESHPEEQTGTNNSNASSERSDLDVFGQEVAKSMMTLLLPQAIPLLKEAPKKKKATISPSANLACREKSEEENNNTSYFACVPPEMLINVGLVVSSLEHTKSLILDSFSDDQCSDPVPNEVISPSNVMEAERDSCAKEAYPLITREGLVGVDVHKSSACCVEASGSNEIPSSDKVYTDLNEKALKGDEHISNSNLGCTTNVFSEETNNACSNLEKKSPDCTEANPNIFWVFAAVNTNAENPTGKVSTDQLLRKDNSVKTGDAESDSITQVPNRIYIRKKVSKMARSTRNYNGPLSETIIYRSLGNDCVPEICHSAKITVPLETQHMSSSNDKLQTEDCIARLGGQSHSLITEKTTNFKHLQNNAPLISQPQTLVCTPESKNTSNLPDTSVSHVEENQNHFDMDLPGHENCIESNRSGLFPNQGTNMCDDNTSNAQEVDLDPDRDVELTNELEGNVELVGCYFHPLPVLALLLSTKGNEIYICVLCGLLADKDRRLFIYKVAIKGPTVGCPSFVGHTSIMLPFSRKDIDREITLESSGLQLTPDGQCLVLLDNIKTPYCSEGRYDCLCSACTSDCFEENALKIVRVKSGYVTVVAKLKTNDNPQCILVCEPNRLIAVGESGRLHLWVMNSAWSALSEEFVIALKDGMSPRIVELKRIPKCASIVLGHNGYGEFSIWDISQRLFISRFSAPTSSINQFFPISLCRWQRIDHVFGCSDVKEYVNRILAATNLQYLGHDESHSFLQSEGEDIAVWLLVSTVSDSDDQLKYISRGHQINPFGWWRLALLVNDKMILGSVLDPRAVAIGALAGQGIIGTDEGHVYMWQFSTGTKLGTLHHFKGGNVSCIATDDAKSGVLAIAGDGGQLLVYMHSPKSDANK